MASAIGVWALDTLNNHLLKAGGLALRTESPDTRRLNDASLLAISTQRFEKVKIAEIEV